MSTTFDLEGILSDAGVENVHVGQREIAAACPMHVQRTGQADTHPSWSINRFTYLHNCFSCGYKGTLTQLLIDLTGAAPEDLELALKEQSILRALAQPTPEEILGPVLPLLTDWSLANILADVPQRLLDLRSLQRAAVDTYEVRWDRSEHRWVLPLRDPAGALMGAQYRQKGSVFTHPVGVEKSRTLFGLCQMCTKDHCVLVESPLDAIRLYGLGIPAVASLGSWVSAEQARLLARNFSVVYVALDNDKAGHEGANVLCPMLRRYGAAPVPWCYDGMGVKDVGDCDDDGLLLKAWDKTTRLGW